MKIALVHDYLNQYGGAERVLECFLDLYPEAVVYTLLSDLTKLPKRFKEVNVQNSFIQRIPGSKKNYKKMLGLLPLAIEQFDLRKYDLILSSSSAFAKGILTNPNQIHICYCHTPMRYAWDLYHQYLEELRNPIYKIGLPPILHKIRTWDQNNSQRVDYFIANSYNVSNRIQKYYGRSSHVIHPPVQADNFYLSENNENFFLIVSRLIPYKRIDLVIQAMNQLKLPLVIIGEGYDRQRLEAMAGNTIQFLGYQPDDVIAEYYSKCRAFILAGEEDFGITPLEAQASGKPVIAYGKGGALETIRSDITGIFFYEQTAQSIIQSIKRIEDFQFNKHLIREHALEFRTDVFKNKICDFVANCSKSTLRK